ncbi:MAG: DNA cytosine methyltransferase [Tagaea sp.]|nr:DNA cytosine methyltransferase [Tagaea sp.]
MNGVALCAGAGGLELGLHLAEPSYRTVCFVERDPFAVEVLRARMQDGGLDDAAIWDDVKSFDAKPWRGRVDILTAGYPCQPFSMAGPRRGHEDPRHLWPAIAKIVEAMRPRRVFVENVAGHLSLGFEVVCRDLQGLGFRVAAGLFSGLETGASTARARVFALADADGDQEWESLAHPAGPQRPQVQAHARRVADDVDLGGRPRVGRRARDRARGRGPAPRAGLYPPGPGEMLAWEAWLKLRPGREPAVPGGDDGLARWMDRARLCGNGVMPLVAAYAYGTLDAALAADRARALTDGAVAAIVRSGCPAKTENRP